MRNLRTTLLAIIVGVIIVVISGTGCSETSAQHTFRPLTKSETRKFIQDNDVNALAVKDFKAATIVLYEDNNEQGNYALAFDENGTLRKTRFKQSGDPRKTLVSIDDGIDFATIIINNAGLLKTASKVTVRFTSGNTLTEPLNGHKGLIVPHEKTKDSNAGIETVTIFDKNNKAIFQR
ncbi:MAG: hypothetical protein ACYC56_05455 [Candidatus Aquicultor sp.]